MTKVEQRLSGLLETTDDAFLGGKVNLLQPKAGYRAGLDAVLLSAAAQAICKEISQPPPSKPAQTAAHAINVLDVGAGIGTVGLCLATQTDNTSLVLFERNPGFVALARENINRNRLSDRAITVTGDINCSNEDLAQWGLSPNSQDIVLANPPYYAPGTATPPSSVAKANAHMMQDTQLEDWCRFMARMAKPGAWLLMIHKVEALHHVLAGLATRAGSLTVLPIHPYEGAPANRTIVAGKNGGRGNLTLLPGFILHDNKDGFTPAAEEVLREGSPLHVGIRS